MNTNSVSINNLPKVAAGKAAGKESWGALSGQVVVGKDILELLSSSMYLDPLTIYREYVQNAIDSIEEGKKVGVIHPSSEGYVSIDINPQERRVRIVDNGLGIPEKSFEKILLSFGASRKRGTSARGFRGVGRLSGLGYCQELIFRTRAVGDPFVSEMRWDCRRLKHSLRAADDHSVLDDVIKSMVMTRRVSVEGAPTHFFEVELNGVMRHRNDKLLSPRAVSDYLSQVAPVPFDSNFKFREHIVSAIAAHADIGHVDLRISGQDKSILRPFSDTIPLGDDKFDAFSDLEVFEIPGIDGGVAAIAFILHHGYTGAIPNLAQIKGLRARCGNVQVGENVIFEELFLEPRFNAWSVGEVHIIDRRIIPNGRRDHFEQNVHFDNLLNHLAPIARDISKRCRASSVKRKHDRIFELKEAEIEEKLSILKQRSLPPAKRRALEIDIDNSIKNLEGDVADDLLPHPDEGRRASVKALRSKLSKIGKNEEAKSGLAKLSPSKRRMYEEFFSLVYECSANRVVAKALIDRIIAKIS